MSDNSQEANKTVEILTCSTALDFELFKPLAESIDTHVDANVHHKVIVPKSDLTLFAPLGSDRRTIHAQEEFLPVMLIKSPAFLKHLASFRAGFRRPVYMTLRGQSVRGWMLQQFLKIELTRRSSADAVLHVDSDVCFFRRFSAEDAFSDGLTTFFRVEGNTRNPMHQSWVDESCAFLDAPTVKDHKAHYIENCVLWDTGVARALASRIESVHNKSLFECILGAKTMSEYYLYGIFADLFPDQAPLAREEVSYCNSFWPESADKQVSINAFLNRLMPKHKAIAVQSTHKLLIEDRLKLYQTVTEAASDL